MRHFHLLAEGVNVAPLLDAVVRQKELWNQYTLRTTHPHSPHTQVDDIWLRFNDLTPYLKHKEGVEAGGGEYDMNAVAGVLDEHESICYPAWFKLPGAQQIIFDLMRRVEGVRLGRVLITRLAPGNVIAPHVDGGSHAEYYERYHVLLKNRPGSIFRCGVEKLYMKPGEVWWFDNGVEHEVYNHSDDDRITMIVDIRSVK